MIIIPAAGDGTRFKEAGYTEPKHLIPLGGKPMIDWVIENVRPLDFGTEVRVATKENVGNTKGAIDTFLKYWDGLEYRDEYEPLVLANCDQLLKFPDPIPWRGDGIVFTFRSNNPAHSYVVTSDSAEGFILDIVEKPKDPPSDQAVSGVYWFREAGDFIDACRQVQYEGGEGEQYISSALGVMLGWSYNLYAVDAPTAILGTPEDFQRFEVGLSCVS